MASESTTRDLWAETSGFERSRGTRTSTGFFQPGVSDSGRTRAGGSDMGPLMPSLFKKSTKTTPRWWRGWSPLGVLLSRSDSRVGNWVEAPLLDAYVTQMSDDGHLVETEVGYLLSWDA